MKNDQNSGSQSQKTQAQLETLLREGSTKFSTTQDANTFLQQHDLTAKIVGDSAEIYDSGQNKVATVMFHQGSEPKNRSIKNISF